MKVSKNIEQLSPAISFALKYIAMGILWIVISDSLLLRLDSENALWNLPRLNLLKGLLFVVLTGGFIFYYIRRIYHAVFSKTKENYHLFSLSPQPLVMLDINTLGFLALNTAAQHLIKHTEKELALMTFDKIVRQEERDRLMSEFIMHRISTDYKNLGNWPIVRKDGQVLMVHIEGVKIAGEQSHRLLLSLSDITTQIKIEDELRRISQSIDQRVFQRTLELERMNEELIFRVRQSEQVNAELIFINEKLQMINTKKISDAESGE